MDFTQVRKIIIPETDYYMGLLHLKGNTSQQTSPAPTPDNPQAIQSVTDSQSVEIDGTTYTIDLGSIELCKIGDYQDYIYRSGNDWYLHKETDNISLAVADMNNSENYPGWKPISKLITQFGSSINEPFARHSSFYTNISGFVEQDPSASQATGVALNTYGGNNGLIFLYKSNYELTQTQWKTNYPDLIFKMYYGLPSSAHTDTQITNAALIAQLDAIANLGHFSMTNPPVITVSATSPNLPAIIPIDSLINDVVQIEQDGTVLWEKP